MYSLVDRWLKWSCGLLSALALFAIMWLMLLDVTGRKFLSGSIPGALEMTEILMVIVIFGALPLVSWRGEHVVFDSLDAFIPPAFKRLQHRLVSLVASGVFALLALQLVKRAERFAEYGEVTSHLQWPMAPVAWTMAGLLAVTALMHLMQTIWVPPGVGEHHHPEVSS